MFFILMYLKYVFIHVIVYLSGDLILNLSRLKKDASFLGSEYFAETRNDAVHSSTFCI